MTVDMKPVVRPPSGRLGDPDLTLASEPRLHAAILPVLSKFQMDQAPPHPGVSPSSSTEERAAHFAECTDMINTLYEYLPNDLPTDASQKPISRTEQLIPGLDGNEVKLIIYRPTDTASEPSGAPLPALIYLHGGGMSMLEVDNKVHTTWMRSLAAAGLVVVGVEFRNSWLPSGAWNPFPAGLNDCVAGVRWVYSHREELGVRSIVLEGESGGGNLSLAIALRANREGWVREIDGVYSIVPFISGMARREPQERLAEGLFSLVENDGYVLYSPVMAMSIHAYDPDSSESRNPLAWPYWATEEDVKGLPPHYIIVDELDPLRDEGMEYFRKLTKAGVTAVGRVNLGLTHGAVLLFRQALSSHYVAMVEEIRQFAYSL